MHILYSHRLKDFTGACGFDLDGICHLSPRIFPAAAEDKDDADDDDENNDDNDDNDDDAGDAAKAVFTSLVMPLVEITPHHYSCPLLGLVTMAP